MIDMNKRERTISSLNIMVSEEREHNQSITHMLEDKQREIQERINSLAALSDFWGAEMLEDL